MPIPLSMTEIHNPRGGWYRGDFHAHTDFSDGVLSPPALAALALEEGLDFFTITDHNTVKAFPNFGEHAGLLIIPGIEVTFKAGHFNAFGVERDLEWLRQVCTGRIVLTALPGAYPTINDLLREIAAHGLLSSINHPLLVPWAWRFQDTDLPHVHCLEIWNDPSYPDNIRDNPRAVELWTGWLNAGHRITAIGGSDFHRPLPKPGENKPAERLGRPSTYVYAENLSGNAILEGLRQHRAIVSMGPRVTFQAVVNGRTYEVGDEIPADAGAVTLSATVSHCTTAANARILRNGETVAENAVSDGSAALSFHDTLAAAQSGWYRLDVIDASGLMLAITNPIYVGAARTPEMSSVKDFAAALA